MRKLALTAFATLALLTSLVRADEPAARPAATADDKPHIDVVFCIDCSGSMGAVIETAKQKVWAIVNEIATAKPAPALRIGLIGYGNFDKSYHQFDLSDDLDTVYKNLLTIKEERWGDEWVGRAVMKATNEMTWSPNQVNGKPVMKVIYVVGNETARQGPPEWDYAKTAPLAIAKGIMVNAIYCGDVDYQTGPPSWKEMAKLADGQYMEIAGKGGGIAIATPYDQELATLSAKLNTTYVGYGSRAAEGQANQSAGDLSSAGLGAHVAADRAMSKSASQYNNATWDLVDARKQKDFDWKKVKDEQLPEEMRKLTPEQRDAYVAAKDKERGEIQQQIKELSAKRDAMVKQEIAKQGLDTNKAFDERVKASIREQGEKKGYKFEDNQQK